MRSSVTTCCSSCSESFFLARTDGYVLYSLRKVQYRGCILTNCIKMMSLYGRLLSAFYTHPGQRASWRQFAVRGSCMSYVTCLTRLLCSWRMHTGWVFVIVFHSDIPIKGVESKPLSRVIAQLQKLYGMLLLLVWSLERYATPALTASDWWHWRIRKSSYIRCIKNYSELN